MNNLSLETREGYASLYDFVALTDDQLGQEEEIWRSLNAFNGRSQFSAEDRTKISDLAYRAKSIDEVVFGNYDWFAHDAGAMGIAPAWGTWAKFVTPPDPEFCRPMSAFHPFLPLQRSALHLFGSFGSSSKCLNERA
jgi:hypothetical protein